MTHSQAWQFQGWHKDQNVGGGPISGNPHLFPKRAGKLLPLLSLWNDPPLSIFPGGISGKEPVCQCKRHKRHGFDPWVGKIPWSRKRQPTPAFLPAKFYGQRSLAATVYEVTKSQMWLSDNMGAKLLGCIQLCNPMDCSLPGSSVHGILQARILEWVVISFSRGSSQGRDWTRVSWIAGRFFTVWATREAQTSPNSRLKTILEYLWYHYF